MKNITAWLTLAVTLTFVLSPLVTSPFSGFTADQLPIPQIDPPVQPAGYAFSIWGLIYGWLMVSAVYGILRRADDPAWDGVRKPLIVSLALGTPWLAIATQSAIWATVLIFGMLISAVMALHATPRKDRWWLQAPIALYAGWLTAASFVSLGSTAAGYGMLTGSLGWAYIGITGALIVALAVQWLKPKAPGYGATVIWALVGIIVANGLGVPTVSALAAVGIVLVALTALRGRTA